MYNFCTYVPLETPPPTPPPPPTKQNPAEFNVKSRVGGGGGGGGGGRGGGRRVITCSTVRVQQVRKSGNIRNGCCQPAKNSAA
jgi:hypothetical protein